MGFLSNNITPGHKQTAAFLKVSNKYRKISSLMQIIFCFRCNTTFCSHSPSPLNTAAI